MSLKKTISLFSYYTSKNYYVWLLANLLIFLPLTMGVLVINACAEGVCVAGNYLRQRDFPISFTYSQYQKSKVYIEKMIRQ